MSRRRSQRRSYKGPRKPRRRSLLSRIFSNRYNPGSSWVSIGDMVENIRDTFTCWVNRVPPGARLNRDRNGKICGWSSHWRGPY